MGYLIGILVRLVIGWLFITKIPEWVKATGILASIIRLVGVLIIISIILNII